MNNFGSFVVDSFETKIYISIRYSYAFLLIWKTYKYLRLNSKKRNLNKSMLSDNESKISK